MRRLTLLGGIFVLALASAPIHAELIDSFETAQSLTVDTATTFAEGTVSGAGMLWGKRYVALQKVSGGVGASVYVNIDPVEVLDFNQDSRVKSTALLVWDGAAHEGESPVEINTSASIDLTTGGEDNGLALEVTNDDLPIDLKITLYGASGSADHTLSLPGGVFSSTTYFIPFTAFSGIDPTDVRAVTLLIDGSLAEGADLTLNQFCSANPPDIPEPATWVLLGLALAGVGLFHRKQA
ncbi:MAG: PEP-CTERM sorting domain-containing protein [Pirellulales bacterium]|nr:PEP-CTERM sorting domain-containing protein [Pirellulales bacterium]